MTFSRKGKGKNLEDGATRFGFEPVSVLRDLGEDAGFAGASSGSERDDTDDVIGTAAVGADEGTAGVSHAGRPSANFTESDNVVWKRPVLTTESRSGPDLSGDLLETVGKELRVTSYQAPSREHALLVSAVVLALSGQASGSSIRSGEVDWFGELHEGDIVVELFWAVVAFVNMNLGNSEVFLGPVAALQVVFANTDGVTAGILGLTEAMGGAEDVLVSDEGSTANVSVSWDAEGDLPWEFAVTGIDTTDDTASTSLLSALLESRGGGDQNQKQADGLHLD